MTECKKCGSLRGVGLIRSPRELENEIDRVVKAIEAGLIEHVKDGKWIDISFAVLSESKKWGDIVEHYFKCTKCGQLFVLSAETYHGSGGKWEPIDELPDE
jgi:hypothetical protein